MDKISVFLSELKDDNSLETSQTPYLLNDYVEFWLNPNENIIIDNIDENGKLKPHVHQSIHEQIDELMKSACFYKERKVFRFLIDNDQYILNQPDSSFILFITKDDYTIKPIQISITVPTYP